MEESPRTKPWSEEEREALDHLVPPKEVDNANGSRCSQDGTKPDRR